MINGPIVLLPFTRQLPAVQMPSRRDLDLRLIGDSAVFGIGWSCWLLFRQFVAFFGTSRSGSEVIIFVTALLIGINIASILQATFAPGAPSLA